MTKYKLLLDESGGFQTNEEKYIIIGGILYREDDQIELEKIFMPLQEHICNTLKIDELHATKHKDILKMIGPMIGSNKLMHSIVFVIDKEKSYIFKKYNKKSFMYNKAIEHLVKKMLSDELINEDDELEIIIDKIDTGKTEKSNLKMYLPRIISCVKSVEEKDSKEFVGLQLADIIVNSFSKKTKCKKDSFQFKILNPKIYCFLTSTERDYIKE